MCGLFKKKLLLETDDDLWAEVSKHKVKKGFLNNNAAVNDLIKKGLLHPDEE